MHPQTMHTQKMAPRRSRAFLLRTVSFLILGSFAALISACGADSETGVRVISPDEAFETVFEAPPEGLVVLDVRTPEEFAAQRLPDATMIDFYEPDFADRIADLDRDVPYVLYCRSGNRSSQTRALMEDLGFTDVRDVEGGIVSWLEDGHPFVTNG